ncbi:MAG: hypothetical protein H6824_20010 [Planctomycetaceae bacterium]|nr:hypothetical protein [Planctomycetaceae bacterium]
MTTTEIYRPGDITLHYYLSGNNSNSSHPEYRSDNPWQKMTSLRDALSDSNSSEAQTVGATLFSTPDESVWRLEVHGAVTEQSLTFTASKLLKLVESKLNLVHGDDIRVIIAVGTGSMREWSLTA